MEPKLYRDPSSAIGLSVVPNLGATEVRGVADLPAHRVEMHTFWSGDWAAIFVEGLQVAGGRNNAFSWRREEERDDVLGSERIVLVAWFNEDRPDGGTVEEVVRIVAHKPHGGDGRRIARGLERRLKEDALRSAEIAAAVAPAIALLGEAGFEARNGGWASPGLTLRPWKDPHAGRAQAMLQDAGWQLDVEIFDHNNYLDERDLDPRLAALVAGAGLSCEEPNVGRFHSAPMPQEELAAAVARLVPLHAAVQPVLLEIWRERQSQREAVAKAERKAAAARRRLIRDAVTRGGSGAG